MSLTTASLRQPWAILALALVVTTLGFFAYFRLPTDLFPDTVPPQVAVVTVYPGAGATDVADKVTQVLEKELNTLSGLVRITSTSRDQVSSIKAEFLYEKPIGEAVTDVQNAVARVRGSLPAAIQEPRLYRITDATRPLLTLALSPKAGSPKTLGDIRLLADNDIKDRLLTVAGVGDVQVFGGHRPEVEVAIDRNALAARGLTLEEIITRLAEQNVSAPAGTIYGTRAEYLLRVAGEFPNVYSILDLPVAASASGQVVLGDIAKIGLGEEDSRSFYHGNGQPAIALNVLRPEGGDTVTAIHSVKSFLPELERNYPDIAFAVTEDQQPIIDLNVHGMRSSLWQAVALTVIVIFLFLANLRAAAVVSISIPLSFLGALVVLWFSPYTLNMVTLSGLIIAVGMVVDASVVVIENVYRHYALMPDPDPLRAAREGASEVALAITAGMLTTVVVLLPVMFTRGFTGRIMTPLNLTIIATLVTSLVVSLTVVPLLAGRLLGRTRQEPNRFERLFAPVGRLVDQMAEGYVSLLRWALRHRLLFMILAIAFLGVSLRLVRPLLGGEEMPPMDTGIVTLDFDTPSSMLPDDVEKVLTNVEDMIRREPGVLTVSSVVGSEPGAVSFGAGGATTQSAHLTVRLVDRTRRAASIWQIEDLWREGLRTIPGVRTFRVAEYGATPVSTTRAPFDLILSGADPEVLDRLGDEALARLRGLPGLVDLRRAWYRDKAEEAVTVDPRLARLYGTSPEAVARTLRAAVQGVPATSLRLAGYLDIPVRVRLWASQVASTARLDEIPVATRQGFVPMSALATLTPQQTAPFVTREGLQPTLDLTAGNQVLTIAQVAKMAKQRLMGMKLPAGYSLQLAGSAADMAAGQKEMGGALLIGLVLLYILLLALFKSPLHPLTIMTSIPFAVGGAFWGLLAFDKPFCKPAFMGIILLGGTIVNNAILMLDFIIEARRAGMPMDEAILQSVRLRLRPILMTATSTIVGFAPLIFEMAVGLERMSPLGIAAGSGLLVGTVVTTVVTPVVYSLFESLRLGLARLWPGRKAVTTALLLAFTLVGWSTAAPVRAQETLPSPLTLQAARDYALAHSPDLEAAQAAIERLTGVEKSVGAAKGLRLDLQASGTLSQEKHGLVPLVASDVQRFDDELYQAGLSARYLLTDFGKTSSLVQSAVFNRRAAGAALERRQQEVTFEVSRLFLTALSAQDLLTAAHASQQSLASLADTTQRLVDKGRAARIDILKVKVRLARVESAIAALEGQHRALCSALAAALGWDGALPELAYRQTEVPTAPNIDTAVIASALAERPDVIAAEAREKAAGQAVTAARRDFLPRLETFASYTWYGSSDPEPAISGGTTDRWEDDAVVGVQFSLPLFDGGLRRGGMEQAVADRRSAEAALKRQRLEARREVETARADLDSALAQVAANAQAATEAEEALHVEQLKYETGKGIINDVLDAEAAWLEAQSLTREAGHRAEIARLALDLALGRSEGGD